MAARRSELSGLKNIGPVTEKWLNAIGVYTRKDLEELGPVNAYKILKGHDYNVTLNLVYAIQGALLNVHWNKLAVSLKEKLKSQLMDRC